jgi:hypothetical protein
VSSDLAADGGVQRAVQDAVQVAESAMGDSPTAPSPKSQRKALVPDGPPAAVAVVVVATASSSKKLAGPASAAAATAPGAREKARALCVAPGWVLCAACGVCGVCVPFD